MITRITLENYMSHARTVIEPAGGLTVIVGPNNCGKSAIASALRVTTETLQHRLNQVIAQEVARANERLASLECSVPTPVAA